MQIKLNKPVMIIDNIDVLKLSNDHATIPRWLANLINNPNQSFIK